MSEGGRKDGWTDVRKERRTDGKKGRKEGRITGLKRRKEMRDIKGLQNEQE